MNNDKERVKVDCCIRGCSGERLTTFSPDPLIVRIPTTPFGLRQQWVHIIRASRSEPEWCPSADTVVCSFHFRPSELLVNPDCLEAELDLENGKNIVPTLRLGDYENVKSDDENDSFDGELRILNDSGVKVTPFVKSEPKEVENEGEEDDPYMGPAMVAKKKGKRRNKPTWSLKELQVSDDESTNRREDDEANSSEYEPSSGSDSDGEKTRESKRRRLSAKTPASSNGSGRPVPGLNGIEMTSGNSFRLKSLNLQQQVLAANQMITTPSRPNGLTNPPKFTLSAATKSSLQIQSQPQQFKPKLCPSNSDVQLMSRWLVELQAVFKTVQNSGECFKMCNFLLTRLFDHIGLYPNSPEKAMISSQLNTITDLVRQKSKEGSTTAGNVHFSLTSKKICDLLHAWMSKKKISASGIQMTKVISSPAPASVTPQRFSNDVRHNQTNLFGGALARAANSGVSTPPSSTKPVVPAQQSSNSPEIVCLDDDNDDDSDPPFSFTIQSVTTLANTPEASTTNTQSSATRPTTQAKTQSSKAAVHAITPATPTSVRAISLQALVKLAQSTSIPKPVPIDFADSVTWMGQPPSEWVYVGYFTEVEHAESNNISRQNITAVPAVLPIGKYPPNVPLGCEKFNRAGVPNPFSSTTDVYGPRQTLTSPNLTQRSSFSMVASERLSQLASKTKNLVATPAPSVRIASVQSSSSQMSFSTASETITSLKAVPNLSEYDEVIILSDSEEEISINPEDTSDGWNVTVTNTTSLSSSNNVACLEDEILGI